MIKFICPDADFEDLVNTVREALIDCASKAISPLWDDYEGTGLDYSSCHSEEDKRRVFAEDFLGDLEIEKVDDGIVLNDMLDVEGAKCDDGYDLENFIHQVQKNFPSLNVSGEGEIDYDYAITGYKIYMDEQNIVHVEYDGDEENFSDDGDSAWNDESPDREPHFSDDLPRIICDDGSLIDELLKYRKQKEDTIRVNKELSYALELMDAGIVLIYLPVNDDAIRETQKVGFPLNPKANGVLFVYESNEHFKTNTDKLLAICSVLNGSDNEWACPNPALLNAVPTFAELSSAVNIFLQDKNLYDEYISMDEHTVLDFQVKNGELVADTMVL